jgi:hypothetical protein
MLDRDPDREEANGAGADDRVGDEARECIVDRHLLVRGAGVSTRRAIRRSTTSQMMLIAKKSAANHDIEERRGQQGHRQERALPLPGKRTNSLRVVTQILQQPFCSGGARLGVLNGQVRHRPMVCCALIAVSVPVSLQPLTGQRAGHPRARREAWPVAMHLRRVPNGLRATARRSTLNPPLTISARSLVKV